MAALATVEQLEARLGRTLDGSDATRAAALLDDASAAVRARAGQTFTSSTSTVRLRVRNGVVRLPQRPVVEVTSVGNVDGDDLGFTYHAGSTLRLSGGIPAAGWVDVTYTHGGDVPDAIVAVVCQMAARALGVKPDGAGYQSENVGDYGYTVGAAAAAGAIGMLDSEREVVDRYRSIGGTAFLAG